MHGVVKGKPYKIAVVLTDGSGAMLQRVERTYKSDVDQSVMPERPLAIGPGYQRNIDASETAYPPSLNAPAPEAPR